MFGLFSKSITTIKNTIFGSHNRVFNIHNAKDCIAFHPQVDWNIRPQNDSFSVKLEWRTRLTELIGRSAEMQALQSWADSDAALSFKIIEAPGGTGKTRIAAEFAQALAQGAKWSAGFANLADFESAQRLGWQGNWCIVVDYPEHSPDKLAQFIRVAKEGLKGQGNDKLRILLLCRHADSLPSKLQDAGAKSYLSATMPLVELATIDNFALITAALAKLGAHKPTPATITQAEFEAWQSQAALHKTALFVLALALHLDTNPAQQLRLLPAKDLLFALVSRETSRWRKAEQGAGAPAGSLANVIGMATLLGGLPVGEVNRSFARAYGWPEQSAAKVLQALQEVWPLGNETPPSFAPISPDLLAAAFLWKWQSDITKSGLTQDAELIAALACQRAADMPALLQRWHMQAYDQTMRLMLGQASEAMSLAALLESAAVSNPVFFQHLKSAFQQRSTWTALFQLASLTSKPTAKAGHASSYAARASELNNYSVDLSGSGDREGALRAALEAVEIRRRLAKANSKAHEPDLAGSVNNLANRLSETGDREGALRAALEAMEIYSRLAKANAAAYEPDLAMSMSNLASRLSETGDRAGALRSALEAVEICRRLAKANAAAYEPDLAMSVSNLANFLSETGDREGALRAALEAVEIRRRLARDNVAAYEPDLAASVNNLANSLSKTGDREGALQAAQEAVEIYGRLANANAAAYQPNLAISLCVLAIALAATGEVVEAKRVCSESVEIYERLALQHPQAFAGQLAGSRRLLKELQDS